MSDIVGLQIFILLLHLICHLYLRFNPVIIKRFTHNITVEERNQCFTEIDHEPHTVYPLCGMM